MTGKVVSLLIVLLAMALAKQILIRTKGKDGISRKAYLVKTTNTGQNDYNLDYQNKKKQEKGSFGCPLTLECEQEGRHCIFTTPYNKNYMIIRGMTYESGRIISNKRLKKDGSTRKKICGIKITNLQEKDIGNWRCGDPLRSLRNLPVSKDQCSKKPTNETSSESSIAPVSTTTTRSITSPVTTTTSEPVSQKAPVSTTTTRAITSTVTTTTTEPGESCSRRGGGYYPPTTNIKPRLSDTTTWEECAHRCFKHPECKFWSFGKYPGKTDATCYLKTGAKGWIQDKNWQSGNRACGQADDKTTTPIQTEPSTPLSSTFSILPSPSPSSLTPRSSFSPLPFSTASSLSPSSPPPRSSSTLNHSSTTSSLPATSPSPRSSSTLAISSTVSSLQPSSLAPTRALTHDEGIELTKEVEAILTTSYLPTREKNGILRKVINILPTGALTLDERNEFLKKVRNMLPTPAPTSDENTRKEIRQELLEAHNKARKKHHAAPLKRHALLEEHAQAWADTLAWANGRIWEHGGEGVKKYGEGQNIFVQYVRRMELHGKVPAGFPASKPVFNWMAEEKNYNYKTGHPIDPKIVIGHFTQVVWKETQEVGCGIAVSRNGGIYVVCNYDPPGNVWLGSENNKERPYYLENVKRP